MDISGSADGERFDIRVSGSWSGLFGLLGVLVRLGAILGSFGLLQQLLPHLMR